MQGWLPESVSAMQLSGLWNICHTFPCIERKNRHDHKKKIFLTNSCMVLLALVVLLLVGGGMLSLFKDELLGWYRDNSKIADQFETVYDRVPELFVDTTDWAKAAEELERYDYRLLVRSEDHKTVFENAKHSEEESAETLYEVKKKECWSGGLLSD